MSSASSMTFAQSYILASKVRTKLTKEASNPRSSLRNLVVQANMLDNIMDYISEETEKRSILKKEQDAAASAASAASDSYVTFSIPTVRREEATSVTEYEVNSDSDDDDEIDYDYEQFSSDDDSDLSDSEDEYYYYSDDEEEESTVPTHSVSTFKELPTINLSLSRIEEEDEEEEDSEQTSPIDESEVPELCRTLSLTDDEEEVEFDSHNIPSHKRNYVHVEHGHNSYSSLDAAVEELKQPRTSHQSTPSLFHTVSQQPNNNTHQRHNAIYSMEHIF